MIRFLLGCLLWGLGFERNDPATSSGFHTEQLVPTRPRTSLEAAIRFLSSTLFLLALIAQFLSEDLDWRHVLAAPGAAWCLLMLCRPSLPMDSTAIGTALLGFAGYLPYLLIGNLYALPVATLLAQAGLVGGLASYGLFRDIRREIKAEKTMNKA
ncbi:MAG: hypothetical protein CAK86_02935 [Opitutia bacterium AMD-G1]|nr:MAG: hypothetical protein CAK86_02935 [Opitutae bacterium AMD-G1]